MLKKEKIKLKEKNEYMKLKKLTKITDIIDEKII